MRNEIEKRRREVAKSNHRSDGDGCVCRPATTTAAAAAKLTVGERVFPVHTHTAAAAAAARSTAHFRPLLSLQSVNGATRLQGRTRALTHSHTQTAKSRVDQLSAWVPRGLHPPSFSHATAVGRRRSSCQGARQSCCRLTMSFASNQEVLQVKLLQRLVAGSLCKHEPNH